MHSYLSSIKRPLCILPKYLHGNKKYGLSPEYNALYLPLKKKFKNIKFINSLESKNIDKLNKKIVRYCKKYSIDYIFCAVFHYEIYIETLFYLKNVLKIFLINWSSDDSWRFCQHSKILSKYFDCMITNFSTTKKFYDKNKINSILSSWGCPENWYHNVPKNNKFDYDILFVGKDYFDRREIVNKLKEKYNVTCYGSGWGTQSLKDEDMSKIFRKAKISLNFSKSRGSSKQVKARIFEIAGSGGFCLTEDSDGLSKFFKNSEIDKFTNYSQLIHKLEIYLQNINLRNNMARKANLKVKKKYLYSRIINKIIFQVSTMKKKKINVNLPLQNNILYFIFTNFLKLYKFSSIYILNFFYSYRKSYKISRRVLFELEWRIRKDLTYSRFGYSNKLYDVYY